MTTPRAASSPPAARRVRNRRGEGELLHAQILAAAERLLLETGDEAAVSIRAVAEAVGVTPPSIYLHFRDRAELVFAVCEEQFAHLDTAMQDAVEQIDDPIARLEARGRAYIGFGLANPEHYRVLMMGRADTTPDRFVDERLARTSAFEHLLEDVVAALAATKQTDDPNLVACSLWAAVHGVTSLLIAKPAFPWPDQDELIDFVIATTTATLRRECS